MARRSHLEYGSVLSEIIYEHARTHSHTQRSVGISQKMGRKGKTRVRMHASTRTHAFAFPVFVALFLPFRVVVIVVGLLFVCLFVVP